MTVSLINTVVQREAYHESLGAQRVTQRRLELLPHLGSGACATAGGTSSGDLKARWLVGRASDLACLPIANECCKYMVSVTAGCGILQSTLCKQAAAIVPEAGIRVYDAM